MTNAEGLNWDSSVTVASELPTANRVKILNGEFDALSTQETVNWAMRLIHSGQRGYLCTVNVAILMMMRSNDRLRQFIEKAALIVADGQPLVWVSHWFFRPLPERVAGIDLIDELSARAAEEGIGIYLLGATPEVIAATAANLQARIQL